ncbi:MAG: hypothetical protein U9R02_08380 [Thermodesulfobacteriota bacterium]|nr:hypothetical protein [Thermodesulfobacteriota bacterium]
MYTIWAATLEHGNQAKVVTPVKTGVQIVYNYLKGLDSANASLRARLSPE